MKRAAVILTAVFLAANIRAQASLDKEAMVSSAEPTHYVGEYYRGGTVFHVEDDGRHGLICAVVDENTRKGIHDKAFADTIDFRGGVASGKILTGSNNTLEDSGAARDSAEAYSRADSYSDWDLATRYDLNKLYLNRHAIGGYAEFAKGWKKVEVSSVNAWFYSFVTGARFTNGKDDALYVRVVRKF
jgi:hypothetical protein